MGLAQRPDVFKVVEFLKRSQVHFKVVEFILRK